MAAYWGSLTLQLCALAKAKQKHVPKKSEHQVATANSCNPSWIFCQNDDQAVGQTASRPFWRLMVDERTHLKFSDFFDTKDGMVKPMCKQLYRWLQNGKVVKYIC